MIGKVIRGKGIHGLVRYLFVTGRFGVLLNCKGMNTGGTAIGPPHADKFYFDDNGNMYYDGD